MTAMPQADLPLAGAVALIGRAGRFPAARDVDALWRLLREGRAATRWLDDAALRAAGVSAREAADPAYVRACLPLDDMEGFDPGFFGLSPRDAAVMDPQHRHFLACAWEALEDAGHPPEAFDGAIGVFGGCGPQMYLARHLLPNAALLRSMGLFLLRHTGNDKDFLTSRVSYLLDLRGPSVGVQTACSTSLVAVHLACQSLLAGECDLALAGAASIELPHRVGYRHAPGEILSPDGHCRAYDAEAAGTVFGSGVALVALRRLDDARRDGDFIHAVIRGSAVNNDGRGKAGYLAPGVDGQARCAAEALAMAGLSGADIDYVEGHGTGTAVGDPIELAALGQAYQAAAPGTIALGSLKAHLGHLDTAAGVASLVKVCLALRHGLLPAQLHYRRPHPHHDLARSPFQVLAAARPWLRGPRVRRAAVHALGVGGTNAHLVLEEGPPRPPPAGPALPQLVVLSARSAAALEALRRRWQAWLAEPPPDLALDQGLADLAFTTRAGRRAFSHRQAVVARDLDGLRRALREPPGPGLRGTAASPAPPVVFLLPGGGAQFAGAGQDLLTQPAFAEAVAACAQAWPADGPPALHARLFAVPPAAGSAEVGLDEPACALPALFVLEYALARLWQAWGLQPVAMLGHSAGEVAAACLAGLLTLPQALVLACARGRVLQAAPRGGMLAVEMSEAVLRPRLAPLGLDIAAVNAPQLCVASGPCAALSVLQAQLQAEGVSAQRLHVAVAAHSRLLEGLAEPLAQALRGVEAQPASLPFLSAHSGQWVRPGEVLPPGYWWRHLRQPVRFAEALGRLFADLPQAALLEVGPGQGLGALARLNGAGSDRLVLPSTRAAPEAAQAAGDLPVMLASAGALWCRGVALDARALGGAGPHRRVPLPTVVFEPVRCWIDAPAVEGPQDEEALEPPSPPTVWATERWEPAPLPPARAPAPSDPPRRWLLVDGGTPLGEALRHALAAQGVSVQAAAPGPETELLRLLEALERDAALPQVLACCIAQARPDIASAPLTWRGPAFDTPLAIARALQRLDLAAPPLLLLVTAGSQPVGEGPLPAPQQALAAGLARVAPREVPGLRARLVDLDPAVLDATDLASAVRQLQDEAAGPDGPDRVAWRSGLRWAPQRVPLPAGSAPRLREGGAYLITGGLGDLGLALAQWLAARWGARLALVGRRPLPHPRDWRALASEGAATDPVLAALLRRLLALDPSGVRVRAYTADAADAARMAQVVADATRCWGRLDGVFHAAGELADAPLTEKPLAAMHRLLAGKAGGALVLHQLLPQRLDLFAVFSSTSLDLAPPGQADYVAANACAEAVAAARPDGLVLRWGRWADLGMAARARQVTPSPASAPAPADGTHPLLGVRRPDPDPAAAADTVVFEAVHDPQRLWPLREHQVAGRAVLPGAAYLEIAGAAGRALWPQAAAWQVRDLCLDTALAFDATPRRVQVRLAPAPGGRSLQVCSQGPGETRWIVHARAWLGPGEPPPAPRAPAGDALGEGPPPRAAQADHPALALGPRWDTLQRLRCGPDAVEAELALPAAFAADLSDYACHPALLDIAATLGLHLVREPGDPRLFVPVAVAEAWLQGPLPSRLQARVGRRAGTAPGGAVFDGVIRALDGSVRVQWQGLCLRAVDPAVLAPPPVPAAPTGLRACEAPALFERALAAPVRTVIASAADPVPPSPQRTARAAAGTAAAPGGRADAGMQTGAQAGAQVDAQVGTQVGTQVGAQVGMQVSTQVSTQVGAQTDAEVRMAGGAPVASTGARTEPGTASCTEVPADAALDPVDQALAAVWRELLGVSQLRPDDDFFALGGHSLVAVRLFARVRRQFGVELPLATLFEAPTLGRLAARLRAAGARLAPPGAAPRPAAQAPAPAWSPLVEIQRGEPGRLPLFCVHGAGGHVLNFRPLADRLGRDQPVCGLQAQGVDGRLPPLDSVPAMATQYLRAVRERAPGGPYRLVGYSGGGLIAFEMAQQLRAAGERVALLAMIDTLEPQAAQARLSWARKLWLARHWSPGFALGWGVRRWRGHRLQARHAQARALRARGETVPPELLDHDLFRHFTEAQARYTPAPWPGPLLLFTARQAETLYLHAGPALGWDALVPGGVQVVPVAGSHATLLADPGLGQVAQVLREALGEALGEAGPPSLAPAPAQSPVPAAATPLR